jgi:hypothetical protein
MMNDQTRTRFFRIAACLFVIPLFVTVGCAGMTQTTTKVAGEWSDQASATVSSTTRLNMAPFAEHLVKLVADIQFGLSGQKPVYTRQYMDGPEAAEFMTSMQEFKRNMARIIAYSGRVISLARSNLDGPKRAKALADFVDVVRPMEKGNSEFKFPYTDEDVDKILENVRQQPNLLTALEAAQPLVMGAAEFLRDRVDEMKTSRLKVEKEVEKQIEDDYLDVIIYNETLKRRQRHNFNLINLLVDSLEKGDPGALEKVAAADAQMATLLKQQKKDANLYDKPTMVLTARLELIDKHKRFIAGDIENFHKVLQELESLTDASDKALQKAKIAVLLWSKAHARLAAGETDPAMFDFMSVAKFAFDLIL